MSRKRLDEYAYDEIYDKEILGEDTPEDRIEELRKSGKKYKYVAKTIIAGDFVECEIYPVYRRWKDTPRAKKENPTRNAQKNLNDRNAQKQITRLIHTNFKPYTDIALTLTYKDKYLPTEEQARKDIQNYIRRVKRARKKLGLPDLKYIYVIGCIPEDEQQKSKKVRIHHHMIVNDMDRDLLEKLWGKGRAEAKRLQPDDFGLEGLARYMARQNNGSKRWYASRNLKKPKIYKSYTKLTKRKAKCLAMKEIDWEETFEKLYRHKYKYLDCRCYISDITGGVYLYCRLRKRQEGKRLKGG